MTAKISHSFVIDPNKWRDSNGLMRISEYSHFEESWQILMYIPQRNYSYKHRIQNTRLSSTRGKCVHVNEVSSRFGWGCIDRTLTSRQVLENVHMFLRSTSSVFLDLKVVFNSVDCTVLWRGFLWRSVPEKFISLIQRLQSNDKSCVRPYGDFSREFTTGIDVR